jgi:hypothetical protein
MIEVSTQELSLQDADLLPAREALSFIHATNVAVAVGRHAVAHAEQTIVVIVGGGHH